MYCEVYGEDVESVCRGRVGRTKGEDTILEGKGQALERTGRKQGKKSEI